MTLIKTLIRTLIFLTTGHIPGDSLNIYYSKFRMN